MKSAAKNHFPTQPQQIVSVLVLTGILSLSTGLTLLQSATAAPRDSQATGEMVKNKGIISDRANLLPRPVASAVRQDLSRQLRIPPRNLKIIHYSQETWADSCLGLGSLVEQCLQGQVEGWRVTLSNGRSSWVYHTDYNGRVLRLKNQKASANLPQSVADAVLQDASRRSRLPISKLRIVEAQQRQWSDGCLGLGGPEVLCAAVVVPGWLVAVEAGQQRLVYRSDSGSRVVLDEAASITRDAGLKLVPIPMSELPPLQTDVVFRMTTSGGMTGRTYETTLINDGKVIRALVKPNGTTSQLQTKQISQQQVRQFQQLLKQQQFARFNGVIYPTPSGAADYITVTLTSPEGTIRYTDINYDRLPSSLKAVLEAWSHVHGAEIMAPDSL